jgi:hypothetical protein
LSSTPCLACKDAPASAFYVSPRSLANILQCHEKVHWIDRRRDEVKMLIEGPRLVVLGMNGQGPEAGDLGGPQSALQDILEQARANSPARPHEGYGQTRQNHQRDRVVGHTFSESLGCIVEADIAEHQRGIFWHNSDTLLAREPAGCAPRISPNCPMSYFHEERIPT